jgi:hypothetical protein
LVIRSSGLWARVSGLETLLTGLVALVLENKRATALINNDHALAEIMASNEPLRQVAQRFTAIVLGPEPTAAGHVTQTVLASGLKVAGITPSSPRSTTPPCAPSS